MTEDAARRISTTRTLRSVLVDLPLLLPTIASLRASTCHRGSQACLLRCATRYKMSGDTQAVALAAGVWIPLPDDASVENAMNPGVTDGRPTARWGGWGSRCGRSKVIPMSAWAGQADLTTAKRIYIHPSAEDLKQGAEQLSKLLDA